MGAAPAPYLFPQHARFGTDNLVLHARARKHSVRGFPGPLSIKTVIDGAVTWQLRSGHVTVDAGSFLLLGAGEAYSLDIDSPAPVETCCVFFQTGFAERVFLDAATPIAAALDDPLRLAPSLPFLSHLHPDTGGALLPHVRTLAKRCREELSPSGHEQEFLCIAVRLLSFYAEVQAQVARLPAVKASTREELFRRLLTARDYMHAHPEGPLSLDAIARTACLSRYHFHRAFTDAFQCTPHG